MSRYVLLVASLGRYRLRTMRRVLRALGAEVTIAAGTVPYDRSIKVLTAQDMPMTEVSNHYGPGGLLWQDLPWGRALGAETLAIDLNPRVISNWALLALRKVLRRRTILWGHAFPRAGRSAASDRLRGWMRSLADGIISYTRSQADDLKALHSMPVYAAPNALYFRDEMGFALGTQRDTAVYVGRLEASKKPALLIEGFALAAEQVAEIKLIVVGDGAELERLRQRAASLHCAARITFAGHVDDLEALRDIYSGGFVSVSPGYVGLSITQSLAFGVPMLIARDENHSPEIEAAHGDNSAMFESDDARSLADGLIQFWRAREEWRTRGPLIATHCADEYSVEAMADGIVDALVGR